MLMADCGKIMKASEGSAIPGKVSGTVVVVVELLLLLLRVLLLVCVGTVELTTAATARSGPAPSPARVSPTRACATRGGRGTGARAYPQWPQRRRAPSTPPAAEASLQQDPALAPFLSLSLSPSFPLSFAPSLSRPLSLSLLSLTASQRAATDRQGQISTSRDALVYLLGMQHRHSGC